MRSRMVFAGLLLFAVYATAGDAFEALLTKDPIAEAAKAFAAGDRRHIVVPVCGRETGEVIRAGLSMTELALCGPSIWASGRFRARILAMIQLMRNFAELYGTQSDITANCSSSKAQ